MQRLVKHDYFNHKRFPPLYTVVHASQLCWKGKRKKKEKDTLKNRVLFRWLGAMPHWTSSWQGQCFCSTWPIRFLNARTLTTVRNAARLLRNVMKATCLDTARLAKERRKHLHAFVIVKKEINNIQNILRHIWRQILRVLALISVQAACQYRICFY